MSGQITIPIPPNYTVVGSAVSHSQVLHRLIVSLVPNGPQPPAPPQILVGGGENGPFFDEKTRQPAGIFAGPQPAGGQLVVNVENKPSGSASFVPSIFGRPLVVEKRPSGDSKEAYLIWTIFTEDGVDRDFNDTIVTIVAVQNQA